MTTYEYIISRRTDIQKRVARNIQKVKPQEKIQISDNQALQKTNQQISVQEENPNFEDQGNLRTTERIMTTNQIKKIYHSKANDTQQQDLENQIIFFKDANTEKLNPFKQWKKKFPYALKNVNESENNAEFDTEQITPKAKHADLQK